MEIERFRQTSIALGARLRRRLTGRRLATVLLAGLFLGTGGIVAPPFANAQRGAAPGEGDLIRGNPNAPVGGTLRQNLRMQPQVLHPLNATDYYGNLILDQVYETLAVVDVDKLQHVPLLAERWEVSADKHTFTFHIDPKAHWQDGTPVTAEDVKFSYDILFHPRLKTRGKWASYFGQISRAETVGERTVRFTAKQDHFLNFVYLAGLRIVPKHAFGVGAETWKDSSELDPADPRLPDNTPLAKQPLGSGPYSFQVWNRGQSAILKRNGDYWGRALPENIGRYNMSRLLYRFIQENKVALEAFKKGDLDLMELTAEQWVRETPEPEFTPASLGPGPGHRLMKLEVKNQAPRRYGYVGWNLESPLFSDKRVRRALGMLFDRDTMIQKYYHGLRVKAVGPFEANSRHSSPKVKPLPFSVPGAIELLKQAGWKDTDGDGILDKDGTALRFTVLTADPDTAVKILTLAQSAMKKAGVELNIKVLDWNALLKLIDEYRFDAVMLGWTRDPWTDPTALWHSRSAVPGGLNLVRYKNPEVDKLIDQGTKSIPDARRVKLFRRVHELIFEDQPYTFMTEDDRVLYAYQGTLRQVRPYYGLALGEDYWWFADVQKTE